MDYLLTNLFSKLIAHFIIPPRPFIRKPLINDKTNTKNVSFVLYDKFNRLAEEIHHSFNEPELLELHQAKAWFLGVWGSL